MNILYSTNCPNCRILKEKLDSAGIEYTEVNDIETMKFKGIEKVPVLEVDGVQMGFGVANAWITNRGGN